MTKKPIFQDKGQADTVKGFLKGVKNGDRSPISFEEISAVTLETFRAVESISLGLVISI